MYVGYIDYCVHIAYKLVGILSLSPTLSHSLSLTHTHTRTRTAHTHTRLRDRDRLTPVGTNLLAGFGESICSRLGYEGLFSRPPMVPFIALVCCSLFFYKSNEHQHYVHTPVSTLHMNPSVPILARAFGQKCTNFQQK